MMQLRREYLILWGFALMWLAVYLLSMLYHTSGRWALPLDDSFIYFQYARQAAAGHFLQYNTGADPTAGPTSILYMLLLVPGFWLGLSGIAIVGYALILGYILLAASACLLWQIAEFTAGRFSAWLSSLLFLCCGPLLWGFYSGMEIGLFSFSILLTLMLFIRGDQRCPYAACLLALSRPEGIVLALVIIVCGLWRNASEEAGRSPLWFLPLGAYGLQMLLVFYMTGSTGGSGIAAKWQFAGPHAAFPALLRGVFFDFAEFTKGILSGSLGHQTSANLYAYDSNYRRIVFAPFFALFFIAELSVRSWDEIQRRKPGLAILAGTWFALGVLATCTLIEYDAHFNRYQQPFLVLYILLVAMGLGRLFNSGGEWGRKLACGFACFFGLWALMSAFFFAVAYGENCSDIRNQQIEMAHFIDANLPPDSRIAINDAGALRYFGRRETVDLIGLTSSGHSPSWRHGSGSVFERLESMPLTSRPHFFAIFPNWFNFPDGTFLQPLHRVRIFAPSIVDAEKVLYKADWHALASGETYYGNRPQGENWRVVDSIDVADLQSEGKHNYQSRVEVPGSGEANLLLRLPLAEGTGAPLVEGGRTVTGGERWRVEIDPEKPALIAMRTVSGIRQHFAVLADGVDIGMVDLPGGSGREWLDLVIGEIPVTRKSAAVEIETRPIHYGGNLRPIVSFHYWIFQQ